MIYGEYFELTLGGELEMLTLVLTIIQIASTTVREFVYRRF